MTRLALPLPVASAGGMRSSRARLFALGLALAVLVPFGTFGRTVWACSMSGRVVDACCCPAPVQVPRADRVPHARAADCCQIRVQSPDGAVSASSEAAAHVPPPALAARAGVERFAVPELCAMAPPFVRSRAPPRTRTRLFIRNCSLLG